MGGVAEMTVAHTARLRSSASMARQLATALGLRSRMAATAT
jgi:hypothetical protein